MPVIEWIADDGYTMPARRRRLAGRPGAERGPARMIGAP